MRVFSCRCGQPVFFRNSRCLACGRALGYDPERGALRALEPEGGEDAAVGADSVFVPADEADGTVAAPARYRRCAKLDTPSGCNWLVAVDDAQAGTPPLCRCCRLLRHVSEGTPQQAQWLGAIETARRRLVARLIALGLPLRSRVSEDTERGLAFDLLAAPEGGPAVITGHADGVITIDLEEADDVVREQRRTALREPYRTLLGHLRHESGHYYWQRLVEGSDWIEPWRALFGDERADYAAALATHYANGAPADWNLRFVSAYASAHPWEDWAETWAHYLHFVDTLETAQALGLHADVVEVGFEPFAAQALAGDGEQGDAQAFADTLRGWMELTGALNELCRSMGVRDFYPFVLSLEVARKLYFVQRVVASAGATAAG